MAERRNEEEALGSYIRRIEDQELKGILLKLKNEIRKPDAPWGVIKTILRSLLDKDREVLMEVLPLILK
ncbi:MAG TPA: hypothetical protein VNK81_02070 [Thermodesulfobacteriota bacterium]|nr:hypothetical protein [Thermodesulfobacteriota bacterium]